jgi:lipoate-protein ligase A
MTAFRLIESGACNAATNMAVDEAIFLCYQEHFSTPTLRLYGWSPASFSIGVSQDPRKLSLSHPFVRRPTGGGALFHDNELTYSFIASCSDLGLSLDVKESYAVITGFLIKTYAALSLEASFAKDAMHKTAIISHTIADYCLSRKEEYDIVIAGKKIGGSAQKRRKNIFLQHGSIPCETLSATLGRDIRYQELSRLVIAAFCAHFSTSHSLGELTLEESHCAENLKAEKYTNPRWNQDRISDDAKTRVA